ncbi:1-aminocyclopropane-1-carboxylate deaminase/D-cysteine desulfhydrase [Aeromonas rivuli]|jgi:1-aminocyclopropane-1-carboxylate deaminase|uniref:1-aminocyclopropane-1-carboxylate deaminase/D-cysteine desulfhydrase n=1 Tax=Aeromonas TaxID=642 RepID=UPI0005A60853|nr:MULTISPECIES: pyridoxal-phosphate dependent enzyme [Aeromonas]MCS3456765.1 1-aminocyclopropane-1-carboxylate deaminase/D-cysteine desulfhydrase-like pyridoxal-dependent ACC family enzyme [Aeromonas sp. BIGb0405]
MTDTQGRLPSPLQAISHPLLDEYGVTLWCKRDDLIHPQLSGNKWRKLKYQLTHAREQGKTHLLSFGGAYSNHIHALAAAGRQFGLKTTGIIRGEPSAVSNPTLIDARGWGMDLIFVDRQSYRRRQEPGWLAQFEAPDTLIIPEGGSAPLALPGVAELVDELPFSPDLWVLPCASGGTLAGLVSGKRTGEQILAIAVLKGGDFIREEVCRLYPPAEQDPHWRIALDHHDGGYAKFSPALWQWLQAFSAETGLPLEPIYSGKAMWGLFRELAAGRIPRGSRIVFIHTGGLQGLAGLREQGRI